MDNFKLLFGIDNQSSKPSDVLSYLKLQEKRLSLLSWLALAGFLLIAGIMITLTLLNNQLLIDTMSEELTGFENTSGGCPPRYQQPGGSGCKNVVAGWEAMLGPRANGIFLAFANEFPWMANVFGYSNPYTPYLVSSAIKMNGFTKSQAVRLLYYLETGPGVVTQPTYGNKSWDGGQGLPGSQQHVFLQSQLFPDEADAPTQYEQGMIFAKPNWHNAAEIFTSTPPRSLGFVDILYQYVMPAAGMVLMFVFLAK